MASVAGAQTIAPTNKDIPIDWVLDSTNPDQQPTPIAPTSRQEDSQQAASPVVSPIPLKTPLLKPGTDDVLHTDKAEAQPLSREPHVQEQLSSQTRIQPVAAPLLQNPVPTAGESSPPLPRQRDLDPELTTTASKQPVAFPVHEANEGRPQSKQELRDEIQRLNQQVTNYKEGANQALQDMEKQLRRAMQQNIHGPVAYRSSDQEGNLTPKSDDLQKIRNTMSQAGVVSAEEDEKSNQPGLPMTFDTRLLAQESSECTWKKDLLNAYCCWKSNAQKYQGETRRPKFTIPEFNATISPEEWFQQTLRQWSSLAPANVFALAELSRVLCTGNSRSWFLTLALDCQTPVDVLTSFGNTFMPLQQNARKWQDANSRKQKTGEALTTYVFEKNRLLVQAGLPEPLRVRSILAGCTRRLVPQYQLLTFEKPDLTVVAMTAHLKQIEETLMEEEPLPAKLVAPVHKDTKETVPIFATVVPTLSDVMLQLEELKKQLNNRAPFSSARKGGTITCYNCGEKGHVFYNCQVKPDNERITQNRTEAIKKRQGNVHQAQPQLGLGIEGAPTSMPAKRDQGGMVFPAFTAVPNV